MASHGHVVEEGRCPSRGWRTERQNVEVEAEARARVGARGVDDPASAMPGGSATGSGNFGPVRGHQLGARPGTRGNGRVRFGTGTSAP